MHRRAALVSFAAAFVVAACLPCLGLAAPPPPQVRQSSRPVAAPGPAGGLQMAPDISVSVWMSIVPGNNVWTRIPPNSSVKKGEALMLGCDIAIAGMIPANSFRVAWYLDGVKTCGEWWAGLHNAPLCEYTWPSTSGHPVYIVSAVSTVGPHTYKCVADVGGQVSERSEQNNSAVFPFSAYGAQTFRPVRRDLPPAPAGLQHP